MQRPSSMALILFVCVWFPVQAWSDPVNSGAWPAGDTADQENSPEMKSPADFLPWGVTRSGIPGLLDSATFAPWFALRPSFSLIDKSTYSLKVSMPSPWGSTPVGAYSGGLFSAGLLASVRLNALPARYGTWSLNTGLFIIRREPSPMESFASMMDPEFVQGVGTVNISITY